EQLVALDTAPPQPPRHQRIAETDPAEPGAGTRCRAEDVAGAKHHATGGQAPQAVERVLLGISGSTVAEVDPEGADDADELHPPPACRTRPSRSGRRLSVSPGLRKRTRERTLQPPREA